MTLQHLDTGLWIKDSYFRVWGCKGSIRMTVLETRDGLVLHSPVAPSRDDVGAIRALGDVHAIVAPNLFHHFYLRDCSKAFPDARVLIPQGLEAKIGPVPGAEVIARERPPALPEEIGTFSLHRHIYLKETLLFHRPSRTLVTADLLYNVHREHHPAEKGFFRLIGCYGAPKVAFYHRLSIRDKVAVREMLDWVAALEPRRIVMSHGRIVEDPDSASIFARAWARFT